MAEQSKIEWCDSTFNPWIGCTKVGPGCDHCYASVSTPVRTKGIQWGPGAKRVQTQPANWKKVIQWNRMDFGQCPECGWRGTGILTVKADEYGSDRKCPICVRTTPDGPQFNIYLKLCKRRVFCASLSDWLDNEVPIEWLVKLLDLVRVTPNLDWLLLTKRVGNFSSAMAMAVRYVNIYQQGEELYNWLRAWQAGRAPQNVWLGATVVNQTEADRDVPKLLQVPARIRFLSIEPMLGPIDLNTCGTTPYASDRGCLPDGRGTSINWVICGGESGPKARPMQDQWCRDLLTQCRAAGVPFMMKQMGGVRDKRGKIEDLPEDLRVREFPNAN